MNTSEIDHHTQQVIKALESMTVNDALTVLHSAFGIVINENINVSHPDLSQPIYPYNPNLTRRPRGGISKVERDPEIKAFIHSLPKYLSVIQIAEQCRVRFGKERAPGKSAVHRYLQGLPKPNSGPCEASKNG